MRHSPPLLLLLIAFLACSYKGDYGIFPVISDSSPLGQNSILLVTDKHELIRLDSNGLTTKLATPAVADRVSFLDERRGWLLGQDGSVWFTDDSANNWAKRGHVGERGAKQLLFVDESNGWMLSYFAVFATHDGGHSWAKAFDPPTGGQSYHQPSCISAPLPDVAWLSFTNGMIAFTKDGGATWSTMMPQIPEVSDPVTVHSPPDIDMIYATGPREAWIAAFGLFHTRDGGKNWSQDIADPSSTQIAYPSLAFAGSEGWLGAMRFAPDTSHSGESLLFHSSDKKSWSPLDASFLESNPKKIYFADAEKGWIIGGKYKDGYSFGEVYRTEDGGHTWRKVFEARTRQGGD